ncbi:MAG: hypothetical protein QM811_15610 [Pirellulales bacterium]
MQDELIQSRLGVAASLFSGAPLQARRNRRPLDSHRVVLLGLGDRARHVRRRTRGA